MEKSLSTVKKRIIITEKQLKKILREKKEYLPADFIDDIKQFMEELRTNPANAQVPERMKSYGIDRPKLIDAIITNNLAKRKQKPKEVEGKNGKKTARMSTIYDIILDNASNNIGKIYEEYFQLGKWPTYNFEESKSSKDVMDEDALFEIEMDDELEETVSAGGAPMADGAGQVITKDCGLGINKKDPTFGRDFTPKHTDDTIRREVYNTKPKKSKTNESIEEASDRSQYWKDRWAKQKAEGTVPDRSEYWKERAKKQKKQKPKRKINKSYRDYIERLEDERDAMDMMTDNDWGEYFGDHRDDD